LKLQEALAALQSIADSRNLNLLKDRLVLEALVATASDALKKIDLIGLGAPIYSPNDKDLARRALRSDQEIIDQTNALARTLYALRGYSVREGYRFDCATHPHEVEAWRGACEAQILLTETDPQDALDEIEENVKDESWR